MGIKTYSPYTPSRRHMTGSDFSEITKTAPEKSLVVSLSKTAGRNNQGKITVRHRGGGVKRNIELSTSRVKKTEFRQLLSESSTIRTEVLTSHLSATLMEKKLTSSHQKV